MQERLAIITSGFLPIPAVKGGAVESLLMNFLNINEIEKTKNVTIFSIYDNLALKQSKLFKNTNYIYIKPSKIVIFMDKIIHCIATKILRRKNNISYRYILQRIKYLKDVSKYLKKANYDKILLENNTITFFALRWNKNYIKYKDRYFFHIHDEMKRDYGNRKIILNSKKIICISEYLKKQVKDFLDIEEENNIVVLKNSIDLSIFNKSMPEAKKIELKKKYNIAVDEKIIMFVGRITKEKGIKEVILAFKKIANKKIKLLIVGSYFFKSNLKSDFEKEIQELIKDIQEQVIFTGFVEYKDMNEYYKIADITVLPSLCNEAAGLTIIESMASGTPVITTNVGGIPEYLNKKSGVLIERDLNIVKNIAISLEKMLKNSKMLKNMGKEGIEATKELGLENYYKKMIKILE